MKKEYTDYKIEKAKKDIERDNRWIMFNFIAFFFVFLIGALLENVTIMLFGLAILILNLARVSLYVDSKADLRYFSGLYRMRSERYG